MSSSIPEWVTSRGIPATSPARIREAILADMMQVSHSRAGLYYHVAMVDDLPWYTDVLTRTRDHDLSLMYETVGTKLTDWADVSAGVLTAINRFDVTQKAQIETNRFYETLWRPQRLASLVGMSAMVGTEFVGWIGAYRLDDEAPFEEPIARVLNRRADAYVHALEVARQLEGSVCAERGLMLLDEAGERVFANEGARAWLDAPGLREGLQAMVSALRARSVAPPVTLAGGIVRLTEVTGEKGARYVAEITPTEAWQPPALARVSQKKRTVAELAAAGATVAEIGRAMGTSPQTVRTHLKQLYELLGVASRLELAEHVRALSR